MDLEVFSLCGKFDIVGMITSISTILDIRIHWLGPICGIKTFTHL